ncbi:mandelate racemase/muconate lactonizing enzyme family protein [Oceanispirochaeta sp.]|jgi:L-alanine-DL-glutamate epimerase-like enolase superfamily enzyme|uniref:mandelate racemase/muconate lactonizing enzyme family protein n=1 Tax=Oceanispirochaeta sp. TaxID=2035350 RepID=UPI0026123EE0|nr:mandelate racemase/muconate lactonizing enzyme family protein [Oceanispirochaeta sp.]MDA3955135.1 mandelate racemase/muconate lactonizing enzyme family protein [Oceanispirochaeta sp.]
MIKSVEPIIISIPRDTPYLGPLEDGNKPTPQGYFIRPGNKSIYHLTDQSVLVKVTIEDGTVGWGECVAFYAPEIVKTIIEELVGPLLIGKDPQDVLMIYEDLYDAMRVRGFFGGFYHDALAGIDIALWDLKGKELRQPVAALLGSKRYKKLPGYVSGLPENTIDKRADLAKKWIDSGFDAFKFASAVSADGIMPEMEALRTAVGSKPKILIDMHWKFNAAEAIAMIHKLNQFDLYVAEAPVKPEDIAGQALVVRSVPVQVAIGEELRTIYEYRPRFEQLCMHVIQPEMGRTGLTSMWNICQMSQAFNMTVMPHASIGVGIFQAASLQVAAALNNLVYHEYQHSIFDKNLKYLNTTMSCSEGFFMVPQEPGIGAEPNESLFQFVKK